MDRPNRRGPGGGRRSRALARHHVRNKNRIGRGKNLVARRSEPTPCNLSEGRQNIPRQSPNQKIDSQIDSQIDPQIHPYEKSLDRSLHPYILTSLHPRNSQSSEMRRRRLKSESIMPAPRTTEDNGSSASCTGSPVSSRRRLSRFLSSAPPPVR